MRRTPALALVTAAMLAAAPPASAVASSVPEPSFATECDGTAIEAEVDECVDDTIDIDVHADGSATWSKTTSYPRAAFDDYVTSVEGWAGTTQDYVDDQLATPGDDLTASSSVTDTLVSVTFAAELTGDDAFASGFALAADGLLYAAVDAEPISGVSRVTMTFPGAVTYANGSVNGSSVTWDAPALADLDELDANASPLVESTGAPESRIPAWMVATGIALIVVIALSLVMGFRPRRAAARQ